MTIPKPDVEISSLRDLANQQRFTYGLLDSSALHVLFQVSKTGVYNTLLRNSIGFSKNRVQSHAHGIERALTEDYVYLSEKSGVIRSIYNGNCLLKMADEQFFPSYQAFIFGKGSNYLEAFNSKILEMRETGLIDKWKDEFYPKDICSLKANEDGSSVAATILHFEGAFALFLTGLTLASLVLLVERFLYWRKMNRRLMQRHL